MGFENLYRQGAGEATVLNFGNVVNTYAQQLAMDNQRRQKEREAYAKELEGVEWTSRNPEEEKYFRDKWESVLERNHQRSQSNNPQEKMKLSSEINMIKKQMLSDGKRLKDEIDLDQKIAAIPLSKDEDEMPDNFGKLLQERRATSIFNPNFKNYGTEAFSAKPKVFDINADIMSNANIAATEVSEEFTVGSGLDARRAYREGKRLDENKFKELILNRIATNPAARRAYLRGLEPTPENLEIAATSAYEAVKDRFALKTRESNYTDAYGREVSLINKRAALSEFYRDKSDKPTDATYNQDWINRMLDGVPGSGEEIKDLAKASGRFKEPVKISVQGSKINFMIPEDHVNLKDKYIVTVDRNDRKQAATMMNQLIGDISGYKTNHAKLMSEGGKQKVRGGKGVEGFENKTPVKSNGFSLDDYLKKKGLK